MVILKRYLQAPAVPITVNVVGAGGTGSMLLTHLARINSTLFAIDQRMLAVTLWDPDIVTEANLGRQMFSTADLGRNKAQVLIERINMFYGLRWSAVDSEADISVCHCNILITCTDTKASRQEIKSLWNSTNESNLNSEVNYLWIDCGNGTNNGNVIVASKQYNWPTVMEYPEWTDTEDVNTPSCSIADAIGRQDLFTNSWVANIAGTWLWQFLKNKKTNWRGAFFNLDKMTIRKIPHDFKIMRHDTCEV